MKKILLAFAVAIALIPGIWLIALPKGLIKTNIERALASGDIRTELTDVEKGFFYSLSAGKVTVQKGAAPLIAASDVGCRLDIRSLSSFRPAVLISGMTGSGEIDGRIEIITGKGTIAVRNAHIEDIPGFGLAGISGTARLSLDAVLGKGNGSIKVSVTEAKLDQIKVGGVPVPLDMFNAGRGAIGIKGGLVTVDSFSMEGDGVYARLKGTISGGPLDMTIEIMPERGFEDKTPVFLLLKNYLASPGHYLVPIKGPLAGQ